MTAQIRHLNINSSSIPEKGVIKNFNDDLLLNREDSAHFETLEEYIKGRLDLSEVKNDPSLQEIDADVKKMISDYQTKGAKRPANEKFIKEIFTGVTREKKIIDEIDQIKKEIRENNLNELSQEWVRDWHEMKQKSVSNSLKTEQTKDFITSSLDSDNFIAETEPVEKRGSEFKKSLLVRYLSLSAAAVIGVFILVRTLVPSTDGLKIYDSFYKPFTAISTVTRDAGSNTSDNYSKYIENYKSGDYQTASIGFSEVLLRDSSLISARFFLGITYLALGNNDQAINNLTTVAERAGEYHKEASWYLGLTYLKLGEKKKAKEYFEILARYPGFYSERSEKLLRRLK